MRRIVVVNQKGGVGKTTTAANLGAALARMGQQVLLIDLDPQGHLSLHFGVEVGEEQNSTYDILTNGGTIQDAVVPIGENISLVPADIDLAAAEVELVSVTGREVILREAVDRVANDYDVMLIDCPPSFGVLTINALSASSEVVIPLQAQFFALQGMGKLFETITLVRKRINSQLEVAGVVLCMHESNTRLAGEVVADLTGFLEKVRGSHAAWSGARLFSTPIRRNIKLAEASSFGQTIFDYAPRSNGAADYQNLAQEVLGERPEGETISAAQKETVAPTPRAETVQADPAATPVAPSMTTVSTDTVPPDTALSEAVAPKAASPKTVSPKTVPRKTAPRKAVKSGDDNGDHRQEKPPASRPTGFPVAPAPIAADVTSEAASKAAACDSAAAT